MKKTIATDDELEFVCRSIIEDFPTLKVEEIKIAFDRIRKGDVQLFERLKGPELLQCIRTYEGEVRAPILERIHHEHSGTTKETQKWLGNVEFEIPEDTGPAQIQDGIGSRLKRKHNG